MVFRNYVKQMEVSSQISRLHFKMILFFFYYYRITEGEIYHKFVLLLLFDLCCSLIVNTLPILEKWGSTAWNEVATKIDKVQNYQSTFIS